MALSHTLKVDLGERSYPIYIGSDLLTETELLVQHIRGNSVLVVTNTTVAPLYLAKLQATLDKQNRRHDCIILDDGEQYKTVATVEKIIDTLLRQRHDRQTTLIALGGGVVGDITGFAASIYQRGVNYIQIPTTLLSQVDSSVGGKTGVNHPLGKNMIGAFYQPQCVIADTDTINTLPARELSAGLAEVIKYGLIHDANFFDWLEQNIAQLLARDHQALCHAILVSCTIKAEIVADDERESGIRAILNLGHTFGHAIEASMGYGNWLHGEAVAAGMVMAADLSLRQQWIDETVKQRTIKLLEKSALPIKSPPQMTIEKFLDAMAIYKKTLNGRIKLILLKNMGEAVISSDYDRELLEQTLSQC
jgi:3-dehydroquinate synthase